MKMDPTPTKSSWAKRLTSRKGRRTLQRNTSSPMVMMPPRVLTMSMRPWPKRVTAWVKGPGSRAGLLGVCVVMRSGLLFMAARWLAQGPERQATKTLPPLEAMPLCSAPLYSHARRRPLPGRETDERTWQLIRSAARWMHFVPAASSLSRTPSWRWWERRLLGCAATRVAETTPIARRLVRRIAPRPAPPAPRARPLAAARARPRRRRRSSSPSRSSSLERMSPTRPATARRTRTRWIKSSSIPPSARVTCRPFAATRWTSPSAPTPRRWCTAVVAARWRSRSSTRLAGR